MNNLFEKAENFGKNFIKGCLVTAGMICCIFLLYFVVMTFLRITSLCWNVLFGHSWIIE